MKRTNWYLKRMIGKFMTLSLLLNLLNGSAFQNNVQAAEIIKPDKVPVILIHGRSDNSESCWGATNWIEKGDNDEFDISPDRDNYYTNISNQLIPEDGKIALSDGTIHNIRDDSTQLAYNLVKSGYTKNVNLFVFNYPNVDFVEKNAELLKKYIENLKTKYGYQQFDLVGHSMGGLVSRFYIENLDGSKYIRKLITIDTPHWGSNLTWGANIKELNYYPCDYFDLNPELSGLFNKNRSDEYDQNERDEQKKLSNPYDQSHTLKLNHGNVKYYAIAGINRWIQEDTIKDAIDSGVEEVNHWFSGEYTNKPNDNIIDLKTNLSNGINSDKDIIDKFIAWEGGQSNVLRHDYLKTVLPTLGDDVVNLYSQIGWADVGLLDGKPRKQVDMYKICVNIDGKFGNNGINNLHSDNQHRRAVIDKTIEYLSENIEGQTNEATNNNMLGQMKVGDYVQFSKYNGQPILWKILDKNEDGLLLYSDKIISFKPFDAAESGHYDQDSGNYKNQNEQMCQMKGSSRWKNSNIREWLNSDSQIVNYSTQSPSNDAVYKGWNNYDKEPGFLSNFTESEKSLINEVVNETDVFDWDTNKINGKDTTNDKVFLLTTDEMDKYLKEYRDREIEVTKEAAMKAAGEYGNKDYIYKPFKTRLQWSRTPSLADAFGVDDIYNHGLYYSAYHGQNGICPALYLKTVTYEAGKGTETEPYIVTGK